MIFRDRVKVVCGEKRLVAGTAKLKPKPVFDGVVPAIVTFVDSSGSPGPSHVSSRLKIYLKPFAYQIPPNTSSDMILSWKSWTHLLPDGPVEFIYRNGRLSHYEILAKAV